MYKYSVLVVKYIIFCNKPDHIYYYRFFNTNGLEWFFNINIFKFFLWKNLLIFFFYKLKKIFFTVFKANINNFKINLNKCFKLVLTLIIYILDMQVFFKINLEKFLSFKNNTNNCWICCLCYFIWKIVKSLLNFFKNFL